MSELATAFEGVVTAVVDTTLELLPVLGVALGVFIGISVGIRLIRRFTRA